MASIFKPTYTKPLPPNPVIVQRKRDGVKCPHVRITKRGTTAYYPLTEKGDRYLVPLTKWYVRYLDHNGDEQTVPGYADRRATEQLAARLEREAAQRAEGLAGPQDGHHRRPLADHVEDYGRFLIAKGDTPEHANKSLAHLRAVVDGCGWERVTDLQPSALVEFLAALREDEQLPDLEPGKATFTQQELADLLGIKLRSVHRLCSRRDMRFRVEGKRRVFDRVEVERLLLRRTRGLGIATSNGYLQSAKAFAAWLVKDGRAPTNPIAHVSRLNPKVDVRKERRILPPAEFASFLESAAVGPPFRELSGADRVVMYLLATNVGFRAGEMATLTPASFDLGGIPATVTVQAAYSKRRRKDTQPLRPDITEMIARFIEGKPTDQPLWPGTWYERAFEMVRLDLERAGIPYTDADGRDFDFHALRHQFITNLAAAGVHPKTAQILARHSTITLTMDRYAHVGLVDTAVALDKLPGIGPNQPTSEAAALRATGTDGLHAPPHAPAAHTALHSDAPVCTQRGITPSSEAVSANASFQGELHRDAPGCSEMREWAEPGLNRRPSDFQDIQPPPPVVAKHNAGHTLQQVPVSCKVTKRGQTCAGVVGNYPTWLGSL